MTFKAVYDATSFNCLILTFLVFDANLSFIIDFLSLIFHQQQINAIIKAMSKLRKLKAQQGV